MILTLLVAVLAALMQMLTILFDPPNSILVITVVMLGAF